MSDAIKEARKRLYEEFETYAKYALKVRTKSGEIKPLVVNEAQKALLAVVKRQMETTGKVRIILLKGRQAGASTLIGAWLYWYTSQRRAMKTIVMTHLAESTKSLFDMTKRFHENCPEILKPSTKYSSRKELVFDKLESSYMVATAGGEGVGRGETLQLAHLSEMAFWPTATARDNANGLLQAIPNNSGTAVFIESTANGVGNIYHSIWQNAVEGKSEFEAVFIPWTVTSEYREPVPKNFERTPEEEEIVAKHGLDDEQLMFRRKKIAVNGLELFQQEYPLTAEEAFITSGRPVFHLQNLQKRLGETPEIVQRLALEGEDWVEHSRGELLLYKYHDPGESYVIGADVSMGIKGGDWSVAQILDSKKNQVGIYRAQVHPDYFADVLKALGYFFNTAKIICENNNHGILTVTRLGKDYSYPNLYFETSVDKQTEHETVTFGFRTTVKTKPLIIDQLRAALRENELTLNDKLTIRELMTYVVTEEGKMEAEAGCHDDTTMALAIANFGHEGRFTPVEVTDDYYFEAL